MTRLLVEGRLVSRQVGPAAAALMILDVDPKICQGHICVTRDVQKTRL